MYVNSSGFEYRPAVFLFQLMYWLGRPESYIFLLSKIIFLGSKYPKNDEFKIEIRSTVGRVYSMLTSPFRHLYSLVIYIPVNNTLLIAETTAYFSRSDSRFALSIFFCEDPFFLFVLAFPTLAAGPWLCSSVTDSADVLVRSPRKLIIFIVKTNGFS